MVNFKDYHKYAEGTFAILQSTDVEKRALKELVSNGLMMLDSVDDEKGQELAKKRIELTARIYGEKNMVRAFFLLMYLFRIIKGLAESSFDIAMPFDKDLIEMAGRDVRDTLFAYIIAAARPDQYNGKTPLVQKFPDIEGRIIDDYNTHALHMTAEA